MIWAACADTESDVRGGHFDLADERTEHPNTTKSGPSLAHQRKWRLAGGPLMAQQ